MNPLLLVGLAVAGLLLLSRASTAGAVTRLNYVLTSIKPEFKGVFTIQIDVVIQIQNPTSTGFTIYSLSGNLSLNGYSLGNVSNFTPTYIAPNSAIDYTIALQIPTFNVPGTLINILQQFQGITADLDATVNVDNLTVPIHLTYGATI